MLIMLSIPLLEGAAFWVLLRNPNTIPKRDSDPRFRTSPDDQESGVACDKKLTLGDKFRYIPTLLKYMIPLALVYLFEYFINQGLVRIDTFQSKHAYLITFTLNLFSFSPCF